MAPKRTSWFIKNQLDMPTMKLSKNALCLSAIRDKTKANLQYVYPRYCFIILIACNIYDIFLNIRQQKYVIHDISCVEFFKKENKKLETNMEQKRKIQHIIDNVSKEFI